MTILVKIKHTCGCETRYLVLSHEAKAFKKRERDLPCSFHRKEQAIIAETGVILNKVVEEDENIPVDLAEEADEGEGEEDSFEYGFISDEDDDYYRKRIDDLFGDNPQV